MKQRKCWDCFWLERIMTNAMMSTCATRHVGAVLVRGNRTVADGFNGNLSGHLHCNRGGCERCNDPKVKSGQNLDRCVCVHAEQNLISYCARNGVNANGTTLYVQTMPCIDCLKLVISSGIFDIVYDDMYMESYSIINKLVRDSLVGLRRFKCTCED